MFKYVITAAFLLTVLTLYSQGFPTADGGQPCGPPFDPCPVPIDGGIGVLIAAGLAYGGKKYRDHKKNI